MDRKQSDRGNSGKMKETKTSGNRDKSIGNQQGTAQTGAQNAGGRNRKEQSDAYTDDLRKSGNRSSKA